MLILFCGSLRLAVGVAVLLTAAAPVVAAIGAFDDPGPWDLY